MRRKLCVAIPLLLLSASAAQAEAAREQVELYGKLDTKQLIRAPACLNLKWAIPASEPYGCTDEQLLAWRNMLKTWRSNRLKAIKYNPARYDNPAQRWTQSSFVQPLLMVHDRYFYDPVARRYTVDRYMDDVEKRYGGIDSVVLWPVYPNFGADDRNHLDMIASMPGGVEGVKAMVDDFHRRGVKVLFPSMRWDAGTRDPGKPWPAATAEMMNAVGADGVKGDTWRGVPESYALAAERTGRALAFEPEIAGGEEFLASNVMTWGYLDYEAWLAQAPAIPVFALKWLEPRHMVHQNDRWARSKADMLQISFFNGAGFSSWESVFGTWNGLTDRDAEALRRIAAIQRATAQFLVSPDWEPYTPMLQYGAIASRWPLGDRALWTIVNRNPYALTDEQVAVPGVAGMRYFDLYHGVEIRPTRRDKGRDILSFEIESGGFGAILAQPTAPDAALLELMAEMKAMTVKPLTTLDAVWRPLPQKIVPIAPTKPATEPPTGMTRIPAGAFSFKVNGNAVEGVNLPGVDVQYPWEDAPRRFHHKAMDVPSFYIDTHPVTNAQYKAFVDASAYRPSDAQNYLRDWKDGSYPTGWGDRPVTWVSLDDARAYAKWSGKRLPHEWEWQYAAQGSDGRLYPWGDAWNADAVPKPDTGRTMRGPDAVGAHSAGASPFGVADMVGAVWQWTEEFVDDRHRTAVLRGGSYYQPQGSFWYLPQAYPLDTHAKYLLMAPGLDRSGGIGFRCVKDIGETR